MGILKKWFGRAPEDIVARTPVSRLEAMAKSSENKDIRCRAAGCNRGTVLFVAATGGEEPMTASGGSFIGSEVN